MTELEALGKRLAEGLRKPDLAFRSVPNTVRQAAADIIEDMLKKLREQQNG